MGSTRCLNHQARRYKAKHCYFQPSSLLDVFPCHNGNDCPDDCAQDRRTDGAHLISAALHHVYTEGQHHNERTGKNPLGQLPDVSVWFTIVFQVL